jgi:hypothetical protein
VISYSIEEDGIMEVVFTDEVSFKDIMEWLGEFSKIPNLPSKIHLIYDLRNANLNLEMVKLIQVAKRTEEATLKFERVRTVFILEESKYNTYSQLFSFLDTQGKTTREVFYDEDEAIKWLLMDY